MPTINDPTPHCDECSTPLKEVGHEVYCSTCDVGEGVLTDDNGDVSACARCDIALVSHYPYLLCPVCYRPDWEHDYASWTNAAETV